MKIVYKETFVKRLEKQLKFLSENNPKSARKLKVELIKRINEIPQNPYLFRKSIYFENDLYDIQELIASTGVNFKSNSYNIKGKGETLKFNIQNEEINVAGEKSELFLETTEMFSDGSITVDNLAGSFSIEGSNSKLISDTIFITGFVINGILVNKNGTREISNLEVQDENILSIITEDTEMFSKKAFYDREKSIIELFDSVTIKRGSEIITGDYGVLDTNKNSYKVSSKNSNKVKAIISNTKWINFNYLMMDL